MLAAVARQHPALLLDGWMSPFAVVYCTVLSGHVLLYSVSCCGGGV